jgi:hypothetical protein
MKRAILNFCRWLMIGAAYALAYIIALHVLALLACAFLNGGCDA